MHRASRTGETVSPREGGRGRPTLPESERRSAWIRLRVTADELDRYCATALAAGLSLSEWVRLTLDGESRGAS